MRCTPAQLAPYAALAATAFVVSAALSCAPTEPLLGPCDDDCNGCCDADGFCRNGLRDDHCGMHGLACRTCGPTEACALGNCAPLSTGDDGRLCRPLNASCFPGADCCSGLCVAGRCMAEPHPDAGPPSCSNVVGERAEQVCLRWKCERDRRVEGSWSGNVNNCDPGDNPVGREHAVRIVNLQRFLAELPEVTNDPTRDGLAQECALLMHANQALSHTPPSSWTCYTPGAAQAAGKSNLATSPGVQAVDEYMVDTGNLSTLGHRRWILSQQLGPIGSGSTSLFSCLWVIGGNGPETKPWVAWPPPGPFPYEAFAPAIFGGSINATGWSIQSNSVDLSGATVSVRDDRGTSLPVTTSQLAGGYGSSWAVRFVPSGWSPEPGRRYDVSVSGASAPIVYSVEVIDCP